MLSWPPGAGLTITTGILAAVGALAIPEKAIGYSVFAAAGAGARLGLTDSSGVR